MAVCCRVSRVPQLRLFNGAFLQLLTDPHHVAQVCLLCWRLEVETGDGLVDALSVDDETYPNGRLSIVAGLLELLRGEGSMVELDQRDSCRVGVFIAM